ERAFRTFRETVIVVVGAGRMLVETVAAALSSGSRRLRVAVTEDVPTEESLLADLGRSSTLREPDQRITYMTVGDRQLSDLLDGAGAVVYASDGAAAGTVRRLDPVCRHRGIPFSAAIPAGDDVWLGPFGSTQGDRPGWMGVWHRLRAWDRADSPRLPPPGAGPVRPHTGRDDVWSGPAPTVVANLAIRALLRLLTGTAKQTEHSQMLRIDMRSLRAEGHGYLPHPFSLAAEAQDPASL